MRARPCRAVSLWSSPLSPSELTTAAQIDEIILDASRPLFISDADEVIFKFMEGLESFLLDNAHYIDLSSFALNGNIRALDTDEPAPNEKVQELLRGFFEDRTATLEPAEGAVENLNLIAGRAQVLVLSNIAPRHRAARLRSLQMNGMNFPVVANSGPKGEAVQQLAAKVTAPVFFVDDIPTHISAVAKAAEHVHRIHYVADPRLAKLLGPAEDSHLRAGDWPKIHAYVMNVLDREGY